jgi:putative selenate reductase
MALMTYETAPFSADLPFFTITDGGVVEKGHALFNVDQPYQIAVLTDFCNECGNCVTACPTSGKPYLDKPRLYLDESEFNAESSNAFMVRRDGDATVVLGRFAGTTHRLSINGSIDYVSPTILASFDTSFGLVSASPGADAADGDEASLDAAATMFALWKGLDESMPQIPVAGEEGTRVAAPDVAG